MKKVLLQGRIGLHHRKSFVNQWRINYKYITYPYCSERQQRTLFISLFNYETYDRKWLLCGACWRVCEFNCWFLINVTTSSCFWGNICWRWCWRQICAWDRLSSCRCDWKWFFCGLCWRWICEFNGWSWIMIAFCWFRWWYVFWLKK